MSILNLQGLKVSAKASGTVAASHGSSWIACPSFSR